MLKEKNKLFYLLKQRVDILMEVEMNKFYGQNGTLNPEHTLGI